MTQEAVVRDVITDDLTDAKDTSLIDREGREKLKDKILKDLKKKTDVKVEEVLFPDVTVQ
jgi:flagellar FliL protein